MILRLVYSFYIISFVTGNPRSHDYAYPQKTVINSNPAYNKIPTRIGTKSFDVEYVSKNVNEAQQVPQPVQIIEEDHKYTGKNICFTPRMVRSIIRAALEYVSQMPTDINNIIDKIDQELNRISDQESIKEHNLKKPLYTLDSKTIFQMLNSPKSEARTNFVLKYDFPNMQEPQCSEAMEKLIEIAYNAYLELEQHPQCREYLYRFASQHPPQDRPQSHLNNGPDMKPLIVSILEQINKHKSIPDFNQPDYYHSAEIDNPIPKIPIPIFNKINVQQFPEIHEANNPNIYEIEISQSNEYNIPQKPEIMPLNSDPQSQSPQQKHESAPEIRPLKPEETVNILTNFLKNNDLTNDGILFDRFIDIVEQNEKHFHPKVLDILLSLFKSHKEANIPRFKDIVLLLLELEKNKQWPWSDKNTEHILSYFLPDRTGQVDPRLIDIILNLYSKPTNEKVVEYILSLLRPIQEGTSDPRILDLIPTLINSHQNNLLRPEHINILLKLLKTSNNNNNGPVDNKEVDIVTALSRWNEMGLGPNYLDTLFTLLEPNVNGATNPKSVDIVHFLLTKNKIMSPETIDFILVFLFPENGNIDPRRIDVIHFLLKHLMSHPKLINILITLIQNNTPQVLNSKFLDILFFLDKNRLLTSELLEIIITLLNNEIVGHVDENQVKTFFLQLLPYYQSNPKLVVDILSLIKQGGLPGSILQWLETSNFNAGKHNRDVKSPSNLYELVEKIENFKGKANHDNEYQTADPGYQPENDFMSIIQWLDKQGLLKPGQGTSNNEVIKSKLLKVLEIGKRELGVVELTYMLKHEKPLIYQPVYYVKYRLPILNFVSNMKSLLSQNPQLTANPMKLIQELIVNSNVTAVSPNLQGYPKEEILKLTFTDGDLVQANILDERNLSLNEQIKNVHGLNAEISPEEILQLNRMNEAKYYPTNVLQFKSKPSAHVTVNHEVDKIIKIPKV